MRILLDECVDRGLLKALGDHEVRTVPQCGWGGVSNGDLLGRAEGEFDLFLTTDQNLQFQQDLARFRIPVVVLKAKSSRLEDLMPLVPKLVEILKSARAGRVTVVED